jgi:hypothetical protein
VDVADRLGVHEQCIEDEWLLEADVAQRNVLDGEDQRLLSGLAGLDGQCDIVANDLVDDDAEPRLPAPPGVVAGLPTCEQRPALPLWRNVELHALHVDSHNPHGRLEELTDSGAKLEALDR